MQKTASLTLSTTMRFPMRQVAASASQNIVKLRSEVIPGNPNNHLVFLHGLFGQAASFRFLAKRKEMQANFTCHLLDMRNHGNPGQWHSEMDYESMARDVHAYLQNAGADREKSVSIVGHSMGGKTGITLACLFPNLINKLVSLDAPPVDRNSLEHLNQVTKCLIETAAAIGDLRPLGYKGAVAHIRQVVSDPVTQSALIFNLCAADASWNINLAAIQKNQ